MKKNEHAHKQAQQARLEQNVNERWNREKMRSMGLLKSRKICKHLIKIMETIRTMVQTAFVSFFIFFCMHVFACVSVYTSERCNY